MCGDSVEYFQRLGRNGNVGPCGGWLLRAREPVCGRGLSIFLRQGHFDLTVSTTAHLPGCHQILRHAVAAVQRLPHTQDESRSSSRQALTSARQSSATARRGTRSQSACPRSTAPLSPSTALSPSAIHASLASKDRDGKDAWVSAHGGC